MAPPQVAAAAGVHVAGITIGGVRDTHHGIEIELAIGRRLRDGNILPDADGAARMRDARRGLTVADARATTVECGKKARAEQRHDEYRGYLAHERRLPAPEARPKRAPGRQRPYHVRSLPSHPSALLTAEPPPPVLSSPPSH